MNINMQVNKVALLITGQMRTYKKCWQNWLQNIIKANPEYKYELFILTEYMGKNGGSNKNKYINEEETEQDFVNNIYKTYEGYEIKYLGVQGEKLNIVYPNYVGNYGPYVCLYRNKLIMQELSRDYSLYIRLRPDVILSGPLIFPSRLVKQIYIVSGIIQRSSKSWLHNRDWDHMVLGDYDSMLNWCNYVDYLQFKGSVNFKQVVPFNIKGQWHINSSDHSVVCTQLFLLYLMNNKYDVIFDYGGVYTLPIRS